ncbi:MAG: hypothetical protein ABIN55_10765, partial [Aeromicrobium sp.]
GAEARRVVDDQDFLAVDDSGDLEVDGSDATLGYATDGDVERFRCGRRSAASGDIGSGDGAGGAAGGPAAGRIVNAIPDVVAAAPGLRTPLDLPFGTARGVFATTLAS